jgi:hypothetical protein
MATKILEVQYKLQYLALEDLKSSFNQKVTNRPIAFHSTINHQHPALIQSVQRISMVVLVFIDHIYTMLIKQ